MESAKRRLKTLKPAYHDAGFKSLSPSNSLSAPLTKCTAEFSYLPLEHPLLISAVSRAAFRKALLRWYDRGHASHPWRLDFARTKDPYCVWVSEIMLQQTVIKAVLPVYRRFMAQFPDVRALAVASEDAVRQAVRGLGYYRRFSFLHRAAQELVAHHTDKRGNIRWPNSFTGWKALPGIGDYTAAAISSICYNDHAAVIDGNVERVFCRLFDLHHPGNAPFLKKEFKVFAPQLLDPIRPGDYNQALMELGQRVCTLASPSCGTCPVSRTCLARQRQTQKLAPQLKTRQEFIDISLNMYVFFQGRKIVLWQRPQEARFLKKSYGFLTLLKPDGKKSFQGDGFEAGGEVQSSQIEPVGTIRHTITKHRITVKIFQSSLASGKTVNDKALKNIANLPVKLLSPKEVEAELIANLDRKVWHALTGD